MGRTVRGRMALSRSVRSAGGLAAALALVGLMAGAAAAGTPAAAPTTSRQSQANLDSCANPANGWTGRFTARGNSSGAGTGSAMVACFPDQASCEKWLGHASGAARGPIIVMKCSQTRS